MAVVENELVGAIWGRKFHAENKGYGYVDNNTPEISMAVKKAFRNRGIGTALLSQIECAFNEIGIQKISLSVDKLNPAKALYDRNGYTVYEEKGTSLTMIKDIKNLS